MYRLMVVDDQWFAVERITSMDWSGLSITEVYGACSMQEAVELCMQHPFDVMLCDIEMPEKSGLELLEWVKSNTPHTQVIMFTGHADFLFAQQAMRQGSCDYLLKPVKDGDLFQAVSKALELVNQQREQQDLAKGFQKINGLWHKQLPILVEKFWQDVLNHRIWLTRERLDEYASMYSIPLSGSDRVIPLLISVEQWKEELSARDEELMDYALRNAAREVVLQECSGSVIQDQLGTNVVLIYCHDGFILSKDKLRERLLSYTEACKAYFGCAVSCYAGDPVEVVRVTSSFQALIELERQTLVPHGRLMFQEESHWTSTPYLTLSVFEDWSLLTDMEHKAAFIEKIEVILNSPDFRFEKQDVVQAFYYGLLNMVYNAVHQRGISVYDIMPKELFLTPGPGSFKTLQQLRLWSLRVIHLAYEALGSEPAGQLEVIRKIRHYIAERLDQECTREEIASVVYLNPAYLSRLFKKETGKSLTEYMVQEKMNRAKSLLKETNMKIIDVGEEVGYGQVSSFNRIFKKLVGMTPQEYRRIHQRR